MKASRPSRRQLLCAAGGVAALSSFSHSASATDVPGRVGLTSSASRRQAAYRLRLMVAERITNAPPSAQRTNGDEEAFPAGVFSFAKTLPHNDNGEVNQDAYTRFAKRLLIDEGTAALLAARGGSVELVNPRASYSFNLLGTDPQSLSIPPPPTAASDSAAHELVELMWQAELRDLPFAHYHDHALVGRACRDIAIPPIAGGAPTTVGPHELFRGLTPGDDVGPYVSQFLYATIQSGVHRVDQRFRSAASGVDYLTEPDAWLADQRGAPAAEDIVVETDARYIATGRDLAFYAYRDYPFQAFLNAALILQKLGSRYLAATPYDRRACPLGVESEPTSGESGYVTFGQPQVLDAVASVANLALQASWYQKWLLHRRLRPEVLAYRFATNGSRGRSYQLSNVVANAAVMSVAKSRTGLLPMAYPDGSPAHPSYPGGHAAVAGACATVLKAFYREDREFPAPVDPVDRGRSLAPYAGARLTVGGELNKLASNIAMARNFAGIHYRSDCVAGLALGEEVARYYLRDMLACVREKNDGLAYTSFSGDPIRVTANA